MSYLTQFAQTPVDTYTSTQDANNGVLIVVAIIAGLIAYTLSAWLMGRIFQKAGIPAWKAWVPVYNSWTMLELGKQPGWWAIVSFIPWVGLISIIFIFIAMYNIGLGFGKKGAFVLWGIFLPIVWYVWLAFDNSTWQSNDSSSVIESTQPTQTATQA
jgi:hypothetical protein